MKISAVRFTAILPKHHQDFKRLGEHVYCLACFDGANKKTDTITKVHVLMTNQGMTIHEIEAYSSLALKSPSENVETEHVLQSVKKSGCFLLISPNEIKRFLR